MDNQGTQANSMMTKWADLTVVSSQKVDYAKLIKCYEKIGMKYLSQNLVRASARGYFFKSGCCFLANQDLVGLKVALDKYCLEDPSFETQREKKFLSTLLAACENRDVDLFGKTVHDYQKYSPLDKVQTKLIVKAKMNYCPEKETAVSAVTNEVNFIDQDEKDDSPGEGGFDLT